MRTASLIAAATLAAALPAMGQEQPRIAASPYVPAYGEPVILELQQSSLQTFLPATRYSISGNNITVDYEYATNGRASPALGQQPVTVGELPPGNYAVTARLYDIAKPSAAPTSVKNTIAVVPPQSYGLYSVPSQPRAFAATSILVRSAAYFSPSSMRAHQTGNVIRVDFDYAALQPGAAPPAGMQMFGAVKLSQPMAPGSYTVEGWGRADGGPYEKFFTSEIVVTQSTPMIEYYSAKLDHYFMAAGSGEVDLIDSGRQGDWKRSGNLALNVFGRMEDAIPGSSAVCRFYASGPNSHFFTGSTQECEWLKGLEQSEREQARRAGKAFTGWAYEGIAFYAIVPRKGQACPSYTQPVRRYYNNRAAQNDSNHRFISDPVQQAAMAGWIDEGVAFCSVP